MGSFFLRLTNVKYPSFLPSFFQSFQLNAITIFSQVGKSSNSSSSGDHRLALQHHSVCHFTCVNNT